MAVEPSRTRCPGRGRWLPGSLGAVVLVADRFSLSRLEGSPRELWVDDGTLDIPLEFFARGAWRLLLTSPELSSIASSRPPREAQLTTRWLAQILAPRPLQGADDAHVARAAQQLAVDPRRVRGTNQYLASTDALMLVASLESGAVADRPLTDAEGSGPPQRTVVDLGDVWAEVLTDAAFVTMIDGIRAFAVVTSKENGDALVRLHSVDGHPSSLLERARRHGWGELNPFRRRVAQVGIGRPSDQHDLSALTLRGIPTPAASRSELLLEDGLWSELDANVGGLFERAELLERLGLGTTRGVLLEGPPGVGKTHAVRVLVSELAGHVTVLVVTPNAADRLPAVYELAGLVAPTLVVIEDLDLVAGTNRSSGSRMHGLLESLDGLVGQHGHVVTVATTNRAHEMDESVRRAARFDRILTFSPPPEPARQRILERCLEPVGTHGIAVGELAAMSEGATGADLREVVRHAVLHSRRAHHRGTRRRDPVPGPQRTQRRR